MSIQLGHDQSGGRAKTNPRRRSRLTQSRPFNTVLDTLKRSKTDQRDLGYQKNPYRVKALITGEIEGNQGDKFTTGELGEYTVGPDKTLPRGGPFWL